MKNLMNKKYLVLAAVILVAVIAIFSNPTLLSSVGPGPDDDPITFYRLISSIRMF